ncbi:MAG: GerMN domain-containing protein [Armatimonadota bacterium]|nr:GerMN domain-containing protein [Armatimonadota bacterium]MDR5697065.1 GerMN domain-containing protein [Armatimonadota bacterium]
MKRVVWLLLAALLAFVVVGLWVSRPREEPALVYFVQWDAERNAGRLAQGLRMVRGRTRRDFVMQAIGALLAGPTAEERALGYASEIPSGTRLRGVRIQGQTAYLDFSEELATGGGSASMLSRLYQIVYTATHFRGVEEVRILIEGQPRETLGGEGVLIDVPVRRPPRAPDF